MKWLALLLVVLNVAAFGWQYEQRLRAAREAARQNVPLPPGTPSLVLVGELAQLPAMKETAKAEPAFAEPTRPASAAPEPQATLPAPYTESPTTFAHEVYAPTTLAHEVYVPSTSSPPSPPSTVSTPPPPEPATPLAETPAPLPPATPPPAPAETTSLATIPADLRPEAPTIEARAVSGGAASAQCAQIGPFPIPRETDAMEAWLTPRATALYRVLEVVGKKRFYWVYLEPESAADAQAKISDLAQKGVKDYLLIKRDGIKNAISLGLFSSQDAVNWRLAEMTQQGYRPIVVPRIEVKDREWLRVNFAAGASGAAQFPQDLLAGGSAQPIPCAELAEFAAAR